MHPATLSGDSFWQPSPGETLATGRITQMRADPTAETSWLVKGHVTIRRERDTFQAPLG